MLEKGKGNLLGKLRTIQLIEGDLQLVMRVLISLRNEKHSEMSCCLSAYNFGNRKGKDINTALLEKQLMKDAVNITNYPAVQYIDDRMSCYDRQLPSIGLIAERSFGMTFSEALTLYKVMANFKHYIMTGHGLSTRSYGGSR